MIAGDAAQIELVRDWVADGKGDDPWPKMLQPDWRGQTPARLAVGETSVILLHPSLRCY